MGGIDIENEYSRKVIGFAFQVFNELGYGLSEKIYQKAFEVLLIDNNVNYKREKYCKIAFAGQHIGKYYLDFLIGDKLAVELKVKNEVYITHINQVLNYLKAENLKLGILLVFSKGGVLVKRVIN